MMTGTIEKGIHPRLMVTLATDKEQVSLKALVDSGFDGQVALHYDAADRYQLEVVRLTEVTYANGQKVEEIVCRGKVLWHNEIHRIQIVLSDDEEPAIGTLLLKGSIMTMNFVDDTLTIALPDE
ncbi:MAG: hypothetical protein ACREOI_20405 [bacterium]